MSDKFVDYYTVLEVSPTATQDQIRTAYKKAALKSHPDRVSSDDPSRPARTRKFQRINDAYYTLSDPQRRADYDSTRMYYQASSGADTSYTSDTNAGSSSSSSNNNAQQQPAGGFGAWANMFGFGTKDPNAPNAQESKFSKEQFGSVFEEMMRDADLAEDEGEGSAHRTTPNGRFWTIVGGASGAAIGFIVGNLTGAVAGGAGGAKLGAIRDKKGKSVYAVYQELPQTDRARLLTELATKLFTSALSG